MRSRILLGIAITVLVALSALAQEKQPPEAEVPVGELVEQLRAADWRLREEAQRRLLEVAHRLQASENRAGFSDSGAKIVDALKGALEDENFEIRLRARQVCDSLGARDKAVKLLGYLLGKKEVGKVIAGLQRKIRRPIARLVSPRAGVRALLAEELGESRLEDALPLIVHLLGDTDRAVQDAALMALGNIKSEIRRKLLLLAAEKGHMLLRCRALLALGRLQEKEAIDEIAKYLDAGKVYFRLAAVESLDFMLDRRAGEHLVKGLKDEFERVRWNSADAFTRVKCKAAVEPLIEAFKEKTARIMSEEIIEELHKLLVPAGFRILTGEEARMKRYLPQALQHQTGRSFGTDAEKWRVWWQKNKGSFDDDMKRVQKPAGED